MGNCLESISFRNMGSTISGLIDQCLAIINEFPVSILMYLGHLTFKKYSAIILI